MVGFSTVGAFLVLVGGFVKGARHLYRDNARGDGQDAVAQYHNKGGDEFAEVGQGHNVAIAHRGKGDDGPVDAQRDAVETVLTVFDDVHETAEHGHQNDDEHHEYEYFAGAAAQGQHQQVAGAYKVVEFEDAVNAQEAHGTDDDEGLGIGRHQRKIGGQNGQEVHDAQKAENVFAGFGGAEYAQEVFGAKEQGDEPFAGFELEAVTGVDAGYAFDHHQGDAQYDEYQQGDVEAFSGRGVGFKYDAVEGLPPCSALIHKIGRASCRERG